MTLTPDTSAIKSSIASLETVESAIAPYIAAVNAIPMGAQSAGGISFDPLAGTALANELAAVQSHCSAYTTNVQTALWFWAQGAISQSASFDTRFDMLLSIVHQVGSGTATAEQQSTAVEAFSEFASYLASAASALAGIHDSLVTFLSDVAADHETLTTGATSLANQVAGLQKSIEQTAMQYPPATENAILGVGALLIGALNSLASAVAQAAIDNSVAEAAMSVLATELATINDKYAEVSGSIAKATVATLGSILQELDLQDAQSAWNQLGSYLASCDLQP